MSNWTRIDEEIDYYEHYISTYLIIFKINTELSLLKNLS